MFCGVYLIDLNATQAAIRAGYSEKTTNEQDAQNLAKLSIQTRISELKAQRNDRIDIDADYMLKRLFEIDQMDVLDILRDDGTLKPITQWPKVWRITLQGMKISTTI